MRPVPYSGSTSHTTRAFSDRSGGTTGRAGRPAGPANSSHATARTPLHRLSPNAVGGRNFRVTGDKILNCANAHHRSSQRRTGFFQRNPAMKPKLTTSFRDLLITGWLIIFAVTVGLVAFQPEYRDQGTSGVLQLAGLAAVGTLGGILLTRFVNLLSQTTSRTRKIAMGLFVACMIALIPVMYVTGIRAPWAVLIVLTLLYARWKWAFVPSHD